jgi:hypothetical protein
MKPRHKRKRFSEERAILMYFKLLVHRLSRHAIMYKGDLRTSSTAVLDRPMSASRWSSSSRSCLHWYRRSHPRAIPASHASGIFQDHLRSGSDGDAASRVLVELQIVLPHAMFHLRNGAKQRLAAGAHRAVVTGPSAFCITPTFGAQATVSGQAERVSSSGQSRHCGSPRPSPKRTTHSGLRISRTFTRLAAITMLKPWPRLALFFSISTAP